MGSPPPPPVYAETVTIDVTAQEYGAIPNDGKDDVEAVIKALKAAKDATGTNDGKTAGKAEHVTVVFPKGEYDLFPDKAEKRHLYVSNTTGWKNKNLSNKTIGVLAENMKNVTIDGQGSTLMFHGKMTTLASIDSTNVTFKDLEIAFKTPTVIDLTVGKIEGNSAIVNVPACYNYTVQNNEAVFTSDKSPYNQQVYWTLSKSKGIDYTQRFDTVSKLTWRGNTGNGGNELFQANTVEEIGDHQLKFTWNNGVPASVTEGLCFQMRNTTRDHPGAFFWQSKDVVLENLDVRFLHGFGMVGQFTENITLNDVDFVARQDLGLTSAGSADFVQMSGCKGTINIKGCDFSNPHDDPINVHGTYLQVTNVSGKEVTLQYMHNETAGFPNYYQGDKVQFFKKSDLLPTDGKEYTVEKVNEGPSGKEDLGNDENKIRTIKLTLNEAPSGIQANQHVLENISYTPSVNISDCTFRETPTRGILVTTRQPVSITNSTFDGMGMAGIFISNDNNGWYESGRALDVTISGNTFTRSKAQAILVGPTKFPSSGNETVHKNFKITGNTFYTTSSGASSMVLDATSVSGLQFKDNKVFREDPAVTVKAAADRDILRPGSSAQITATGSTATFNERLYNLNACRQVTISGNTYDGGLNARVNLSNIADSDVTVTNDQAKLKMENKLPLNDQVVFESTDPAVLSVDENGKVTGVNAGKASVKVKVRSGERVFDGTEIAFTVSEDAYLTNARLRSLELKSAGTLSPAFNPDTDTYALSVNEPMIDLVATAQEDESTANVTVDGIERVTAKGSAPVKFAVNEGDSEAIIRVTAADGETVKEYKIVIKASGDLYLSDLEWSSAVSGDPKDNPPRKDLAANGGPISLLGKDGKEVVFEHGLGNHASAPNADEAYIEYNIADLGFTSFTTKYGIDGAKRNNKDEANVIFKVLVDGEVKFTSEVMREKTPFGQTPAIDVTGAKTLRLVTVGKDNNWSGHADWAEPTLSREFTNASFAYDFSATEGGAMTSSKEAGSYENLTEITVRAMANEGYAFLGWFKNDAEQPISTDATYTFKLIEDTKLTAKFAEQHTVTVGVNDPALGSAELDATDGVYVHGAQATATATPADGAEFTGWTLKGSDEVISTEATYTLTVNGDMDLVANFAKKSSPAPEPKPEPTPTPTPNPGNKPGQGGSGSLPATGDGAALAMAAFAAAGVATVGLGAAALRRRRS